MVHNDRPFSDLLLVSLLSGSQISCSNLEIFHQPGPINPDETHIVTELSSCGTMSGRSVSCYLIVSLPAVLLRLWPASSRVPVTFSSSNNMILKSAGFVRVLASVKTWSLQFYCLTVCILAYLFTSPPGCTCRMKPSSAGTRHAMRPLYFFDQVSRGFEQWAVQRNPNTMTTAFCSSQPSKQKGILATANVLPLNLEHQGTQVEEPRWPKESRSLQPSNLHFTLCSFLLRFA